MTPKGMISSKTLRNMS